jgi:hypothetical protein
MLAFYSTTNNLGGALTATTLYETAGSVLPNVTTTEALHGATHYACIGMKNTGSTTINVPGVYIASQSGSARLYLALGLTGINSTTEQVIASNIIAPVGDLVYHQPTNDYAPLRIGVPLAAGQWYHLWLKRVVSPYASGESNSYFILTGTES